VKNVRPIRKWKVKINKSLEAILKSVCGDGACGDCYNIIQAAK
jgi:hypothetical protein